MLVSILSTKNSRVEVAVNKKNNKQYNVLKVAIILSLILVLSSAISIGSAFYKTSNEAKFNPPVNTYEFVVENTGSEGNFTIDLGSIKKPGDSVNVNFTVKNGSSNIKQQYIISVSSYNNLPLQFTLKKGNIALPLTNGNTVAQSLSSSNQSDSYVLTVTWPASNNNVDYLGKLDHVTVEVKAEQSN